MSDFETMPVGTRAAIQDAAQLFRSYERHHRENAGYKDREQVQQFSKSPDETRRAISRLAKAQRNAEAAAKLEALLDEPETVRVRGELRDVREFDSPAACPSYGSGCDEFPLRGEA